MATDAWDPRAAPPGAPIGFPAITSAYPQPPSPPNPAAYTDPVSRPAPTLTTLAPNTAVAATVGTVPVTITGTNFTNATRLSFGGVVDHYRVDDLTYISPTTLRANFTMAGLPASSVSIIAVNQDGQASTPAVTFTLT